MKLTLSTLFLMAAGSATAFAPVSRTAFATTQRGGILFMATEKSLDDEVEEMVQKEMKKSKFMSNLRNEKGVEYAPWMGIDKEQEAKIRAIMREKAATRRKRQIENQEARGSLMADSAFQELSGTGLKSKVVDGDSVELEWATGKETSTNGFIVKRRPAKTNDFQVIASYKDYGPLASKGTDGGVYRYLDTDVPPGGWVYRITECEANGEENDLSQCLVDIQTAEEQRGTILAVAAFGALAVAALVAGVVLDPVQY